MSPRRSRKLVLGAVAAVIVLIGLAWFLLHRPRTPPVELTQKRLTFNFSDKPVQSSTISPDGKYLAYSDPTGIHVKLLSTGEERVIPKPVGVPAGAGWFVASWFPGGTQLLANTWEPNGRDQSIWTVSLLGQSAHELRDSAFGFGVSPDGMHIVFVPGGAMGYFREIWIMGSQGNNPQKLLAFGENEFIMGTYVRWSPDGKRLAYIRARNTQDGYQCSLETCDLKGANRTVVLSSLDLQDLCWLPDRRIIYSREESGSLYQNLWQIGINDHTGMPTGPPRRITQWTSSNISGLAASADGNRLVFAKVTSQNQVYVGALAAARMNPPRRLTNDEANDAPFAWTPDSKAVLFNSDRNGTSGIFKQQINADEAQAVITGPQDAYHPVISADGAWMLYHTPGHLMRVPIAGGAPQFVLEMRNGVVQCARAPASVCIILEETQDQKQLTLSAFDPLKGRGNVLRTMQEKELPVTAASFGLSPDGSTFAIARESQTEVHIRLLSLSGSSDREITVKGWSSITGLNWSADGKGLYCGTFSGQGSTLLYVDLAGNERVLWQNNGGNQVWGIPSPNGRYLAIFGQMRSSNVWMLEGF